MMFGVVRKVGIARNFINQSATRTYFRQSDRLRERGRLEPLGYLVTVINAGDVSFSD